MMRAWRWVGLGAVVVLATLAVVAEVMVRRAGPILKGRVVETLSDRFESRVELDELDVSVIRGLEVSGKGLRIFAPDDVVAAGAKEPVIGIRRFRFHAGLMGLFVKPTHVGVVRVEGLSIHIPPREVREAGARRPKRKGKTTVEVDEIVCDDSELVIGTMKPNKDPKVFELKHIVLHDVGPNAPWPYDATLMNAVPKGEIHAVGRFGPWNTETPGDSGVTGRYTFDRADLYPIKGIGGTLESVGEFGGVLDRIGVKGTANVPNFSLDTANHAMRLETAFEAVVDGTSGDTYLTEVRAKLGGSEFTCKGAVINVKGVGHAIDLDVDVPAGRIQDFLGLAVKTQPAVMTGVIETKEKLHLRPGKESVVQKLSMAGGFTLTRIHFTNPQVQDKVDGLSERAEKRPKEAKPGAADVMSTMRGRFTMSGGALRLSGLDYKLPGGQVLLDGVYTLDGKTFEFRGKVRTEAKLSEMVASRWKSWLLKPVDPFFHKNGAGAEIPVKITGTEGAPKFGLDLGGKK